MSEQPPRASSAPSTPLTEIRAQRLRKAATLREMGINPYPSRSARTQVAGPLVERYGEFEGQTVTIAGRILSWRKQGALSFGHLQDQTGRIQLYLRRDTVQPTDAAAGTLGYTDKNLLDIGDIIEATGTVTKTERGEISILVSTLKLLSKALRPLPEKWAGLRDREAILRRRYLDTTLHPERRQVFEAVANMLYAIRSFLDQRGFLEFHTPVIQPQYGGGTAKPFKTHVNALDVEMYLAISHELYLKRLIVAGYDRVYTIGRYFRNEGIDRTHHPEFSMLETMTAYENYEFNMELVEDLFRHVGKEVFGRTEFTVREHRIDFGAPWRRILMAEAVAAETGIDFRALATPDEANAQLAALGLNEPQRTVGEVLALAFEERVGPTLITPTLVYGHPVEISPLAKAMASDPRYAERFEIYVGGVECGDNWTEQNDPVALLEVWRRSRATAAPDDEVQPIDYDFVEALEYGMPPTTGIGPGIERMAMLFTENENIDDVLFFPMMRPVVSQANRAIYGVEAAHEGAGARADVPLTLDDFEALLAAGALRPESQGLRVQPHLKIWGGTTHAEPWSATGHFEVTGFFEGAKLLVSGYSATIGEKANLAPEKQKLADFANARVATPLRDRFPDWAVTVAEAEMEQPGE